MSFGFSVGDFVLLIQLAKTAYKNCVEAGSEYTEIAREIRSLHSVLKPLRDEAEKLDSGLFRQDQESAVELKTAIDGCTHILEDLQILLAKYEGLSTAGEAVSAPKKLWHRFRFSTKIEQLGVVRGKLISYTSTISVLLDAVQLRATGRVEEKLDNVSSQMTEGFESLKKVILGMAVKARAEQRGGSTMSLLSLSTYAEDDKEVWREFRRELLVRGFRSKALDRHKDLLQAYMLKLDQSGLLDEVKDSSVQNKVQPWWKKHAFVETVDSLPGLQPIEEEGSTPVYYTKEGDALPENSTPLYCTKESDVLLPPPPDYSINDTNKDSSLLKLPLDGQSRTYSNERWNEVCSQYSLDGDTLLPKAKSLVASSDVAFTGLPWPTDSEESEKETTGLQRPRRVRKKRKPEYQALIADPVKAAADFVTETASEAPRSPPKENYEHCENANTEWLPSKPFGVHIPDSLPLHASNIGIDGRSEQFYGDPFRKTLARDQTELSCTQTKAPSTLMPSSVIPQPSSAAAESKDEAQTSLHDNKFDKVLQDGNTFRAPKPLEPFETSQKVDMINKIARSLHPNLARLPAADLARATLPERPFLEEMVKQDLGQRANRRVEAARDHVRKRVAEQFLPRLEDPFSKSIDGRGRKYGTRPRTNDSTGRTQSPKSKRAAARAVPARPILNQTQSDPVPRLGTGQRAQIQERPKADGRKSSSTGTLGAVALGLAGLSVILTMRKRAQARATRRRRGYISDASYDTCSDTYSNAETSDSEDDRSLPRHTKRKEDVTGDVRARSSDVSNMAPIGSAFHAGLDAWGINQDPQSTATDKRPLNAYMESVSESDPELPGAESIIQMEPSTSLNSDLKSGKETPPKKTDSGDITNVDSKRDREVKTELKETLSSMETSNMSQEVSPAVAQEENLERRFILPDRIPNNKNESMHPVQAGEQRNPTSAAREEDSSRHLSFECNDGPWISPNTSTKKGTSQISGQKEGVDRRDVDRIMAAASILEVHNLAHLRVALGNFTLRRLTEEEALSEREGPSPPTLTVRGEKNFGLRFLIAEAIHHLRVARRKGQRLTSVDVEKEGADGKPILIRLAEEDGLAAERAAREKRSIGDESPSPVKVNLGKVIDVMMRRSTGEEAMKRLLEHIAHEKQARGGEAQYSTAPQTQD